MSEEKLIKNCAPTLAGIKTANLFNEYFNDKQDVLNDIKKFNLSFKGTDIKMVPIAFKDNRALIYVYRISDLKNDFTNNISKDILARYGYNSEDIYMSIKKLTLRIENLEDFPHEIGLFLGYPPNDVKGFIDNKGKNYKSLGYWKVYDDVGLARKTFKKYELCQQIYLDRLKRGTALSQLIISK